LPFGGFLPFYGPSKPHFGQRYGRPNFLQREHRHIVISPQFGHGNFVASVAGGIILWHDVHVGIVIVVVVFSFMMMFPSFFGSWFGFVVLVLLICAVFSCL